MKKEGKCKDIQTGNEYNFILIEGGILKDLYKISLNGIIDGFMSKESFLKKYEVL